MFRQNAETGGNMQGFPAPLEDERDGMAIVITTAAFLAGADFHRQHQGCFAMVGNTGPPFAKSSDGGGIGSLEVWN